MKSDILNIRLRTIALFLVKARKAAGLTQKDVSDHLGYSTAQFISNWERGLSLPPIDALPKLAEVLGIEPKKLQTAMDSFLVEECKLHRRHVARALGVKAAS